MLCDYACLLKSGPGASVSNAFPLNTTLLGSPSYFLQLNTLSKIFQKQCLLASETCAIIYRKILDAKLHRDKTHALKREENIALKLGSGKCRKSKLFHRNAIFLKKSHRIAIKKKKSLKFFNGGVGFALNPRTPFFQKHELANTGYGTSIHFKSILVYNILQYF